MARFARWDYLPDPIKIGDQIGRNRADKKWDQKNRNFSFFSFINSLKLKKYKKTINYLTSLAQIVLMNKL